MTSELTGEALEAAIAEEMAASEERYRQWVATTTPEQLAAMKQRNVEAMERLLIVYGHKYGVERMGGLAQKWNAPDDLMVRVRDRMKMPPREDPDLVSASYTWGGLSPR